MNLPVPKVALYYSDDAYVETIDRPSQHTAGKPVGLMGRQVAGKEFLDAYLTHGNWSELTALTTSPAATRSLFDFCQNHPTSRFRKRVLYPFELNDFHNSFVREPPASILHFPCPVDANYAWVRRHSGPASFSLSGVTHTLCSTKMVHALCEMVTAPFEAYDALICTSQAVADMVRTVTSNYADYMKDRQSGDPRLRIHLETIPLGVNPDKFAPATPTQRRAKRNELDIAEEDIVVLFVGRLSHHAKAHPFPMFHSLSKAAEITGKKIHLLLSGWTANKEIYQAFEQGARLIAPNVRVSIIDGTKPEHRFSVWHAADIFTSLSDNIQETFGLVITEAMSCGLPVVASDWNGYRDLITDQESGFLIPTTMIKGATENATSRVLVGENNYDQFLAETSQCVSVDHTSATNAFVQLIQDAHLRQKMGSAGRERVLKNFAWEKIIKRYEDLWSRQDQERLSHLKSTRAETQNEPSPVIYPSPETTFFGYPTNWLTDEDLLEPVDGWEERIETLISMPLTSHAANCRCNDPNLIRNVLKSQGACFSMNVLMNEFQKHGVNAQISQPTIAWLMKYDVLHAVKR